MVIAYATRTEQLFIKKNQVVAGAIRMRHLVCDRTRFEVITFHEIACSFCMQSMRFSGRFFKCSIPPKVVSRLHNHDATFLGLFGVTPSRPVISLNGSLQHHYALASPALSSLHLLTPTATV